MSRRSRAARKRSKLRPNLAGSRRLALAARARFCMGGAGRSPVIPDYMPASVNPTPCGS